MLTSSRTDEAVRKPQIVPFSSSAARKIDPFAANSLSKDFRLQGSAIHSASIAAKAGRSLSCAFLTVKPVLTAALHNFTAYGFQIVH